LGQIANQNIAIEIPQISSDGSNIGKLVDSLAEVDGINIGNLVFEIKDKTTYLDTARDRAFRYAQRKAEDFSESLSLTLGKVIYVEDDFNVAPLVQSL